MTYPVPTQIPYSEEFRRAVINANPDNPVIQALVAEGNCSRLGLMLRMNAENGLGVVDIVSMLESGRAEELLKIAQRLQIHQKVYKDWQGYNNRYNPGR